MTTTFDSLLPLAVMSVSLLAGVLIFLAGEKRQVLRITLNIGAAVVKLALIGVIAMVVLDGREPEFWFVFLFMLELVFCMDVFSLF